MERTAIGMSDKVMLMKQSIQSRRPCIYGSYKRRMYLYILKLLLILIIGLFYLSETLPASELRLIRPIPVPGAPAPGAIPVEKIKPVSRELVENAVRKIVQAWNNKNLEEVLGEDFYDRDLLIDAMSEKVPRDAELRILSIQGIQTLSQHVEVDPSGNRWLISTVSATVRTQVEFNDPDRGFQRREGTNEYIFLVKEKVK